jgi:2-methylcitrate dehydratase PrpD
MTKPFHAGHAAEGGVRAALLAERGFTASHDVLEGRHGFAKVAADIEDLSVFNTFGEKWGIVDYGGANTAPFIKPFPSCGATHAAMEAMIYLIEEHDISPEDVVHVDAGMNLGGIESLPYTKPKDFLQAKFSMQYCLAILLLERKAGLSQFTDEKAEDPEIVKLMKRIVLSVDEKLNETLPLELCDLRAVVRLRMKDGTKYEKMSDIKHLGWEEIVDKYRECASFVLRDNKLDKIIDMVKNLEKFESMHPLMDLIRMEQK